MLPKSHALSGLSPDDGFKIQQPIQLTAPSMEGTVAAMFQAEEARRAQKQQSQFDRVSKAPTYRPIRDVIPFTEGRLMGWKIKEHCLSAKARNWPGIKPFAYRGQSVAICGGGPSLGETLHELRALQKKGTKVVAINRTHDYLINLPKSHRMPWIKPWAGVLLEPTPNAAKYMTPTNGVRYYVGSQCAPETFDRFEKHDHVIWHARAKPELEECLSPEELRVMIPAMGSTCGIRSILLFYMQGFTDIHLFGFDSCYNDREIKNGILGLDGAPKLHSYYKAETIHDFKEMVVKGFPEGDRKYFGNGNMLAQADEFQMFCEWRKKQIETGHMDPHSIKVHGFGLIPDIAREYGLHIDNKENA